jgi:hypothetical protein
LISGELAGPDEGDIRRHLQACQVCRSAYTALQETWEQLGQWPADATDIDLTERIMSEADSANQPIPHVYWPLTQQYGPLRAAASIVLALGLGVTAGLLMPKVIWPSKSPEPRIIDGGQVAESLGLNYLATDSATGLPLGLDVDMDSNDMEVPS